MSTISYQKQNQMNSKEGAGKPHEVESVLQTQEIKVDGKQSPLRIDKFLVDRTENLSRHRIQLGIRAGLVTVNERQVKPNYKVRPHDVIRIVYPKTVVPETVVPEDIPLDIVYEDAHLMVVNKPAGMVVHPGISNYSGTLVNALAYHAKNTELPVLDGNPMDRPGLVHRIDKDTSGLLVVAKTEEALVHLAKQFFDHTVHRRYLAMVWGEPEPHVGTIDLELGRDMKNRTRMAVYPKGEGGKHAVTHYEVVEPMYYVSMVECRLETGRTHQIRVHMKHIGHPIFSDRHYGGDTIRKGTVYGKYKQFVHNCFEMMPRQALHARSLGFEHPVTGENMYFEAPLPEDFHGVLDKWRNYLHHRKGDINAG